MISKLDKQDETFLVDLPGSQPAHLTKLPNISAMCPDLPWCKKLNILDQNVPVTQFFQTNLTLKRYKQLHNGKERSL